jgi:SAM-dependent methyltransferase
LLFADNVDCLTSWFAGSIRPSIKSSERAEESWMTTDDLPGHVQRNRTAWDHWAADRVNSAVRDWASAAITWGTLNVPEAAIHLLPDDLAGLDVIELGCGTAYVSAWLARRGAKPVGIDNSPRQLERARAMQDQFDLHFPLHLGNAEDLPFPDASFDLAISEYGASIWCDPYAWIPEAARVLRPGGQLVFLCNGLLTILAGLDEDVDGSSVSTCLQRPLFGLHRVEWQDNDAVEFYLPHGEMIRVLRASGFAVEQLLELAPVDDRDLEIVAVPNAWARQWPAEEVWCARKR